MAPTRGPTSEGPGRRFFVPIAVPSPGEPFAELAGVPNDLRLLRSIFVEALGYSPVPVVENPSADQLRRTLTEWLGAAELGTRDSVVLYYSGHGYVDPGGHYLCTRGFRKEATADGLKSGALVELIVGRRARPGNLWLILDCCHAGGVLTAELCRSLVVGQSGAFVLAASSAYGQAADGAFSAAFYQAVRRLGRSVSLDRVTAAVNAELSKGRRGAPVIQFGYSSREFDFLNKLRADSLPDLPGGRRRRWGRVALASGMVLASVGVGALAGVEQVRRGKVSSAPEQGLPPPAPLPRTPPVPAAERLSVASGPRASEPFTTPSVSTRPPQRNAVHLPTGHDGRAAMGSDACVRLLERQSLGELLSSEELASLGARCRD